MLVQFTLKNVLSFKEETTLDMTAINAYKEHECNLIDSGNKEKFVRVAAIYGANASGKSNICLAMDYFQGIIDESFNIVGIDEETAIQKYYEPFSFESEDENSEFEIVLILDNYEYKYGFEYNAECIATEWLYRKDFQTNRISKIFERTTEEVVFGSSVKKECDVYKEQIPKETLVLSFFYKLIMKTDIFKNVYLGIRSIFIVTTDFWEEKEFDKLLARLLPKVIDENKDGLMEFLTAIDTGIQDIEYDKKENKITFRTFHKGKDGKRKKLDLYYESEGTLKSIMLYIHVRIAILYGKSLFVDELDNQLHPLLLKFIIDLFYDSKAKAQLIYTTHNTTLLDKKFFRRDQIWFVQKDEFGYSELSALSDFKVRSDASFEKDYLAGVYGGIPLLKEFNMKEGK